MGAKIENMKNRIKKLITTEVEGIGVVEIILILVVLIGLVIIFRDQIGQIVTRLFNNIKDSIDTF